jgi:1-phosphatidylinositol-3-phosphate 5-kinase
MESPQLPGSPLQQTNGLRSTASSSINGAGSTRLVDDVTILTSFNPFSEEDEHDQSSYTLVTSLFSRVKNSLAAPLSSAVAAASNSNGSPSGGNGNDTKRPAERSQPTQTVSPASKPTNDAFKPRPFKVGSTERKLAPPLISVIPIERPTFNVDGERNNNYSPTVEQQDGGMFGTTIPGFPIQDDARSVHTTTSFKRSGSVSKVIRRIRGEGEHFALRIAPMPHNPFRSFTRLLDGRCQC